MVSENCKLNQILQTLIRYLVQPLATPSVAPSSGVAPLGVSLVTAFGSGAQASNNKSTIHPIEATKPIPKKRCSSTSASSSGFGFTYVDTQRQGDAEEVLEFEKFTVALKEFWNTWTSFFLFGMQTFLVHILQCEIANDEYKIRKMESEIVKSVKAELVQMGNINQWQKICLTSIDEH